MNMMTNRAEVDAILETTATIAANKMFYACEHLRQRLDTHLNRHHREALETISRFLGSRPCDRAEFFNGRLTTRDDLPF